MSARSAATYPHPTYSTWLAVDLGACIVRIETTGPLGTKDLRALYQSLGQYADRTRAGERMPQVLHRRLSRWADARIHFMGFFDARSIGVLNAAVNDRRELDRDEIDERRQRAAERARQRLASRVRVNEAAARLVDALSAARLLPSPRRR